MVGRGGCERVRDLRTGGVADWRCCIVLCEGGRLLASVLLGMLGLLWGRSFAAVRLLWWWLL